MGLHRSHRDRQKQERNRSGDQLKVNCLKIETDQLELAWLRGSFTGELKSPYLAGLSILDNIESGQIRKLARWLDSIQPWTKSHVRLGRIVWIRFLGLPLHVWSERVFKKLAEQWGELAAINVDTKERTWLYVARFAILTPILSHISLIVRLMVDKDEFPIFIAEEGMATIEKPIIIASACKGISDESSKASLPPSLASLSVVLEFVGENIAAEKLPIIVFPWESNTEVQNPILVINDSMDSIREEPIHNDGLESGKIEFCWKFREDRGRKDDGGTSMSKGTEVGKSRLDMDFHSTDLGDPKTHWVATEKVMGYSLEAQLRLDIRREGFVGPSLLLGPEDRVREPLLADFRPSKPSGVALTNIQS
ncbi:hypothetical protein Ancab_017012 [Ancistrocladus abbreviatus]